MILSDSVFTILCFLAHLLYCLQVDFAFSVTSRNGCVDCPLYISDSICPELMLLCAAFHEGDDSASLNSTFSPPSLHLICDAFTLYLCLLYSFLFFHKD